MSAIEAALNSTRKFGASFIVNLPCILESEYERMCVLSVRGVTDPPKNSR
jgi:hypothetical protein